MLNLQHLFLILQPTKSTYLGLSKDTAVVWDRNRSITF